MPGASDAQHFVERTEHLGGVAMDDARAGPSQRRARIAAPRKPRPSRRRPCARLRRPHGVSPIIAHLRAAVSLSLPSAARTRSGAGLLAIGIFAGHHHVYELAPAHPCLRLRRPRAAPALPARGDERGRDPTRAERRDGRALAARCGVDPLARGWRALRRSALAGAAQRLAVFLVGLLAEHTRDELVATLSELDRDAIARDPIAMIRERPLPAARKVKVVGIDQGAVEIEQETSPA